jgi:hypothetical protein
MKWNLCSKLQNVYFLLAEFALIVFTAQFSHVCD